MALARARGLDARALARTRTRTRNVARVIGGGPRGGSNDADGRARRDDVDEETLTYVRKASTASSFEERAFGDDVIGEKLLRAMRVQWTHGFASTPSGFPRCTHGFGEILAGMQPAACDLILRDVLSGSTSVLDPFAGGGTTLVCAATLGMRAVGTDVSPLACFVSAHRCWRPDETTIDEMVHRASAARDLAKSAEEQSVESDAEEAGDGGVPRAWRRIRDALRASNGGVSGGRVDESLWFCMSVALQRTQKSQSKARPRKGKGKRSGGSRGGEDNAYIFYKVVEEYADRLRQFRAMCSTCDPQAPDAEIHNIDVRRFKLADEAKVDAVLTSCPYPAVYDYLSFARKVRAGSGAVVSTSSPRSQGPTSSYVNTVVPGDRNWPKEWMEGEIGSRRALRSDPYAFRDAWQREQEEWLEVVAHSLKPRGRACIMVGDGANIDTRASMVSAAEKFGLKTLAGATMKLTTTTESGNVYNQARTEHLIIFEKH